MWQHKKTKIAATILKKKNKLGEISLPDYDTYLIAIVIKTVWYQVGKRHINQWRIDIHKLTHTNIPDF